MPYRPSKTLINWTAGLLIANIIMCGLYAAVEIAIGIGYPDFYDMSAPIQPGEDLLGNAQIVVGVLFLLSFLPTIVVFCVCINRLSHNVRALGARNMRFTPGWAVGYFFIPILNLFRPYQAVKEIELASSPDAGPEDWHRRNGSGLVGLWWTFWITSSVFDQIASQMASSSDPGILHDSSWPSAIGSLLTIAAGYFVIRAILRIHRQQETKVRVQPHAMQSTCLECGYDIRGTPGLHCPECGAPIPGRDEQEDDFTAPDPLEAQTGWTND